MAYAYDIQKIVGAPKSVERPKEDLLSVDMALKRLRQ
jgi:hypothetical protein